LNFVYSNWYGILLKISDVILLSLLWAIVSIPLITIYPATIALVHTMRKWADEGQTGQVWMNFFMSFRVNLKIKLLYSVIVVLTAISSYVNIYLHSKGLVQLNEMVILLMVISNGVTMLVFFASCINWDEKNIKVALLERLKSTVATIIAHPFKSIVLLVLLIFIFETVLIYPMIYFIVGIVLGLLGLIV